MKANPCLLTFCLLVCAVSIEGIAADLHVNNLEGDDANSGTRPQQAVRTIAQAIGKAKAGDTIHLIETGRVYRQSIDFYGHPGGEPGQPITVEGHGVTLRGTEICSAEGWTAYRDGIVRRDDVVSRMFLLVDGEMVFETKSFAVLQPGEFCYQPDDYERLFFHFPEGKTAEDFDIVVGQEEGDPVKLDPAQWQHSHSPIPGVKRYNGLKAPTWIKVNGKDETLTLVTAKDRLKHGQWTAEDGTMYFRLPHGRDLENVAVEAAVRANGVQMNGAQGHFVIRDLMVEYVYNDGFNIHGEVKDAVFENCDASHCGDEGFSAHDACDTVLDGAVYIDCDNGIANVNRSGRSVTRNVVIRDSRSVGFLLVSKGSAKHEVESLVLIDNPAQFTAADVVAKNLLILRSSTEGSATTALNLGRNCRLEKVTTVGNSQLMRLSSESSVTIADALFGPRQGVIHVRAERPMELLSISNILAGGDIVMQWGTQAPWSEQSLAAWLAEHPSPGRKAAGIVAANLSTADILASEGGPAQGCSDEVWRMARRFIIAEKGGAVDGAVAKPASPAPKSMMDDSPVTFPDKGALLSKYPSDLVTERQYPKDDGYSITTSPARSLEQIDAIQAEMPKGEFTPPPTDWKNLAWTRSVLADGGDLHVVGLGDSIVNDTFRSAWLAKLSEAYPRARIRGNVYVRGGGGCRHYWVEDRVPNYLVPLKPDLVFIGGISQQKHYEAIRSVIGQIRDALPETEILLASGAFGNVDPRRADLLAKAQHSGASDYGVELKKIAAELDCAFLDMTTPWAEYIRSSGEHPHRFYRDRVHANAFGEQILSKILLSFFDVAR